MDYTLPKFKSKARKVADKIVESKKHKAVEKALAKHMIGKNTKEEREEKEDDMKEEEKEY